MDFETMIRAAFKEGKSLEDIASEVEATLNKVQEETKTAVSAKQKLLYDWGDIFDNHWTNDKLNLKDVGTIAALICEDDHPDWTIKDLEEFRESVSYTVSMLANMQTKNPDEILSDFFKELFGTREKRVATPKTESKTLSDYDRIREFLRTL